MQPTIGRIINYQPTAESRPWPALITDVRSGEDIDITIFPPGRPLMHRQHVTRGPLAGQWDWPVRVTTVEQQVEDAPATDPEEGETP